MILKSSESVVNRIPSNHIIYGMWLKKVQKQTRFHLRLSVKQGDLICSCALLMIQICMSASEKSLAKFRLANKTFVYFMIN